MPITVSVPWDGTTNFIGPGALVFVSSDFVGPLPAGSYFHIAVSSDSEGQRWVWQEQIPTNQQSYTFLLASDATRQWQTQGWVAKEGDQMYVNVELHEPTSVIDSGQVQAKWTDSQLYVQQLQLQGQTGQGGFTTTDRANLTTTMQNTVTMDSNWQQYEQVTLPSMQDALNNIVSGITSTIQTATGAIGRTIGQIFSGKTTDVWATNEVVPETCGPINYTIGASLLAYGFVVEVTQYPPWIAFTGPGDGYAQQSLAVVNVYRGGEAVYGTFMHSIQHTVYPLPGAPTLLNTLDVGYAPPDYVVTVDWQIDCCGRLLVIQLP